MQQQEIKHTQPQYDLYVRKRDNVARLVTRISHEVMPIKEIIPLCGSASLLIRFEVAASVCLMSRDIHFVEELPEGDVTQA